MSDAKAIDQARIEEWKAILKSGGCSHCGYFPTECPHCDRSIIRAAYVAMPLLLAEVERLRGLVRAVGPCPICGPFSADKTRHVPDCALARELEGGK